MSNSSSGIDGRVIFRVGIALVMVGLLLLFRYTIEWFGPAARLALGAGASVALMVAGVLVSRRTYGRLMEGAGVAGAYATAWAAHGRYELVDDTTAFIQLLLVAALGLALAWRERSDSLNALGLLGAVAAPLLVGGEFGAPGGEILYQSAILALAGVLYARFGWWMTLAATVVGSGAALFGMLDEPSGLLLVGVFVWWAIGWLLPTIGPRLGWEVLPPEIVAVFAIPVPVTAWVMVAAIDGREPVTSSVAAVAALVHLSVWWMDRDRAESVVQLLVGFGFGAVALLIWLDVTTALPLYLLATGGTAVYGSRVGNRPTMAVSLSMAVLALPVWLLALGLREEMTVPGAVEDLASVLVVAATSFLLAGVVQKIGGLVAYGMALVWIAKHLMPLDPGYVTVGFAVVGLAALVLGRLRSLTGVTVVGLLTLAMAVAKLILVDLASAAPILKIALSLGIGVALLAVGYWIGDTKLVSREVEGQPTPEPDAS